jgi:hypothetical protein
MMDPLLQMQQEFSIKPQILRKGHMELAMTVDHLKCWTGWTCETRGQRPTSESDQLGHAQGWLLTVSRHSVGTLEKFCWYACTIIVVTSKVAIDGRSHDEVE